MTCQVGAESALKKEIARLQPSWRFSYSRPGFLTFKSPQELTPSFDLRSIFARAHGLSLGKSAGATGPILEQALAWGQPKLRLHVWERDQHPTGEEPPGYERGQWSSPLESALRREAKELFHAEAVAQPGDWVLDVVAVEPREWWFGLHVHSGSHSPYPGGRIPVQVPSDAPSRAFTKLEEGIAWSGAPVKTGDMAVEIGSAPGGASYALLKRGLKVVGIDPGDMADVVLKNPAFVHLKQVVASVRRDDLPPSVQWLLLDMNVEPRIALQAADRLSAMFKDTLLGVLLTVKLNQWEMAEQIPQMLKQVEEMGMTRVRGTQLPSNKQEIFLCGLSRKGSLRFHS
jgi:23S rRNA (cytidine2498-2'-O)-methyltransferase